MKNQPFFSYTGMYTTALRWVTGWTYFSAFWRRTVLENKLDPDAAGYIGEKFNHFLPHALGIGPVIEYLVSNPEHLWWAMLIFTLIEGVVGFLFMLGLFTRLMSFGVLSLALGILLGSGWLGTTCLDEWQIGILGVAAGFTIFFSGGGVYSLDEYFVRKQHSFSSKSWFALLGSGPLPLKENLLKKLVLMGSVAILLLALFTNQYFHGGVYGKLHNLSVRPHVTISEAMIQDDRLSFTVFRDEGADVYGSFLIGIRLRNEEGTIVFEQTSGQLAQLSSEQIVNQYVARVTPGKHSLVLPLGAKASLQFVNPVFKEAKGKYTLELLDISGLQWTATFFTE